jgi:hypothetical protein
MLKPGALYRTRMTAQSSILFERLSADSKNKKWLSVNPDNDTARIYKFFPGNHQGSDVEKRKVLNSMAYIGDDCFLLESEIFKIKEVFVFTESHSIDGVLLEVRPIRHSEYFATMEEVEYEFDGIRYCRKHSTQTTCLSKKGFFKEVKDCFLEMCETI